MLGELTELKACQWNVWLTMTWQISLTLLARLSNMLMLFWNLCYSVNLSAMCFSQCPRNIEDYMTSDTKCNTTLHLWINKEAWTNRHIPTLTLNKQRILEQISYDTTYQQLSKPLVGGGYSNQAHRGFSAFTARHQKKTTHKQTWEKQNPEFEVALLLLRSHRLVFCTICCLL